MPKRPRKPEHANQHESDDAVKDFVEWQEHQYLPGYYVGGRFPPYLGHHPPSFAFALVIGVGLSFFCVVAIAVVAFSRTDVNPFGVGVLICWGLVAALQLFGCLWLLRRPAKERRQS